MVSNIHIVNATYYYPGTLFAESTSRLLGEPTLKEAFRAAPDDNEGFFKKDGWYAVRISVTHKKKFVSGDGEERWEVVGNEEVVSCIIGEKVHYTEVPDDDRHRILRSNIKNNDRNGGYGVKTRCGNWQISSDWDVVLSPEEVRRY